MKRKVMVVSPPLIDELIDAIDNGALTKVQQLISVNKDLLTEHVDGFTPLHYAVLAGQLDIVNELLHAGVRVDECDSNGHDITALMFAAEGNHPLIIKTLLAHGAKNPYKGAEGESRARVTFKSINEATLLTLMEHVHYELNPHRHVKIWLSKDPSIFMNSQNQLRLVTMRASCPDDEINLIYDSRLLCKTAHDALHHFCSLHAIKPINVLDIFLQCRQPLERELIKVYEDEIFHLHLGGNLAAASDILRWFEPIFRLGIYSDLDAFVRTKELDKTITVFGDALFTTGNRLDDPYFRGYNNDVIAIADFNLINIQKVQQSIVDAYMAKTNNAEYRSTIMTTLRDACEPNNPYIEKLSTTFLGVSPRVWRQNIPVFIHYLQQWHQELTQNNVATPLSRFVAACVAHRSFEHHLYLKSIVESTGPSTVAIWQEGYSISEFAAHSLSLYPALFKAFSSSQSKDRYPVRLNMPIEEIENRAPGDLSWMPSGQVAIMVTEQILDSSAVIIQKAWKQYNELHREQSLLNVHDVIDSSSEEVSEILETKLNKNTIQTATKRRQEEGDDLGDAPKSKSLKYF